MAMDDNNKVKFDNDTIRNIAKALADIQQEQQKAQFKGSSITLIDYMQDWLQMKKQTNIDVKTYEGYESRYRNHIKPFFEEDAPKLTDVDTNAVSAFVGALREKVDNASIRFSMRTLHDVFTVLSIALNEAVRGNYIPRNPCDNVSLPKVKKTQKDAITKEEVKKLYELTREANHFNWIAIPLLFATGMRRGELLALTWKDVRYDIEQRTYYINITKAVGAEKKPTIHAYTKTQSGVRRCYISENLYNLMMEYREKTQHNNRDYVIAQKTKNGWREPRNFNRTVKQWCDKAGLPDGISPHSFRHAYATYMMMAGQPMDAVMRQAGWSNERMIHYYTDDAVMSQKQPEVAGAMGRLTEGMF